jgi:1-acyl-sn-glycerol-3-phosphate acyltransferase
LQVEFKPENFSPFRRECFIISADFLGYWYRKTRGQLTVTGRENVPRETPVLIVANHLSYWDPPLLAHSTMRAMGYVAKEELFDKPFFGKLIELYCAISIKRDRPDKSTIRSVKSIFQAGWCVGMFIEGTRNPHPGVMGQPHLGAAYFARANKVPILPIGLVGTNDIGGHAYVHVGKLMPYGNDLEETTWRIMEALSDLTGFKIESREIAVST